VIFRIGHVGLPTESSAGMSTKIVANVLIAGGGVFSVIFDAMSYNFFGVL